MSTIVAKKITGTSPASASTTALGSVVADLDNVGTFTVLADLVGATGGTLDVYLQSSPDGSTWYDWAHFPQLAAGAAAVSYSFAPALGNTITTVGKGTSPVLAAGLCVGSHPGRYLRALCVAGTSTSAGAAVTVWILCANPRA